MLDDFTKIRIHKIMTAFVQNKVPSHLSNQLKLSYMIRGNFVTLSEERPAFRSDAWVKLDIAQFRREGDVWTVYWRDSKNKWHWVDDIEPSSDFETQLKLVEDDNRGMFWG